MSLVFINGWRWLVSKVDWHRNFELVLKCITFFFSIFFFTFRLKKKKTEKAAGRILSSSHLSPNNSNAIPCYPNSSFSFLSLLTTPRDIIHSYLFFWEWVKKKNEKKKKTSWDPTPWRAQHFAKTTATAFPNQSRNRLKPLVHCSTDVLPTIDTHQRTCLEGTSPTAWCRMLILFFFFFFFFFFWEPRFAHLRITPRYIYVTCVYGHTIIIIKILYLQFFFLTFSQPEALEWMLIKIKIERRF